MENRNSSIRDMKPGDRAEVVGFGGVSKSYRERLLSMGLTTGTSFVLKKVAPMGDPVEIEVRGFKLSLRKQEADALKVRVES